MIDLEDVKICVIGLGYVGLPLAVGFSNRFDVIGYDVDTKRISELKVSFDRTEEISKGDLSVATRLAYTNSVDEIKNCNVFIVTVPTPIDEATNPNLTFLNNSCVLLGRLIDSGAVVIFESTVYPGATETFCVPILEKTSGLKVNKDFYVGYSPERINPGDDMHKLTDVVKIVSGSNNEITNFLCRLYGEIVSAGIFKASSIQVAEAAKVIENTQRDINIALINEFAIIFNKLGIDTADILEAAFTKWNFLKFYPGLVGGHCIGVDPHYLTYKAKVAGYHPELILAGRRINEGMATYVTSQLVKRMIQERIEIINARVLVLGLTFKENCPDTRNSKVFDIVEQLTEYGCKIDIYDPYHKRIDDPKALKLNLLHEIQEGAYDAVLAAVGHKEFKLYSAKRIRSFGKRKHVVYDIKNILPKNAVDIRL